MASCAACLQPILRSQQFALDGTEVFHRACVGQAYRSKLRIAEKHGFNLERQLEDTRRAAARVDAEANQLRNEATSRGAEVITLTSMLSGTRTQLFASQDRLQATQDELRASRTEIAALRAELATVKREARADGENDADSDLDASARRFQLLELDLP
jgi:chromosome segregation ATPase